MGWNGWPISKIAPRSHACVASTRCRGVCANDDSPSTETSTVPAGIAATRSSVAVHALGGGAPAIRISGALSARPESGG